MPQYLQQQQFHVMKKMTLIFMSQFEIELGTQEA
jgi:hypothetical protein